MDPISSQQALLHELKAQRAAALAREVSMIARLPNNMANNMAGAGAVNLACAQRPGAPGDRYPNAHQYGAWASGPMRRREIELRLHNHPYANAYRQQASRTASNASSRTQSDAASSCGSYMQSPSMRPRDVEAGDVDAVAGLLSLSPLNSPALASCVDILATPDLKGIVHDIVRERQRPRVEAPPDMWLPAARGVHMLPPRTESASPKQTAGYASPRNPTPPMPVPPPTAGSSPPIRAPSPTPLTQQVLASWDPENLMGSPRLEPKASASAPSSDDAGHSASTPEDKPLGRGMGGAMGGGMGGMGTMLYSPKSNSSERHVSLARRPSLTCLDLLAQQGHQGHATS